MAAPAAPDETTRRAQLIVKNGGRWVPAQTLITLASSKTSDAQLLQMVEAMRKSLVQGFHQAGIKADDGFKQFADDPVLHKDASLALGIKRYITNAVGPWPIKDSDLVHIQKRLQAQGFGKGLAPDGAWSPDWDNSYRQWTSKLYDAQLSGKKNGSTSFGDALKHLGAVLPKEALNAMWGFTKSLPHAARQALADVVATGSSVAGPRAGATAGGFVMGQNPNEFESKMQGVEGHYEGNKWMPGPDPSKGFMGISPDNPDGQVGGYNGPRTKPMHVVGRAADDIGTILIAHDIFKLGANVSKAVGEGVLKRGVVTDLAEGEAARAGGLAAGANGAEQIDRSAVGRVLDRVNAGNIGTPAERTPGAIANLIGRSGDSLAASRLGENIPGAKGVGAWLGRAADSGNLYYRSRTLLASAYRYPLVNAAGTAVSDLGITGAKARAIATVAGGLGGENLRQVNREHGIDAVDDAIANHLDFTVRGHHIQPHLDDLAWFMHGPMHGEGSASARFGDRVDDVKNGMTDALGRVGYSAAWEQATGVSTQDMIEHLGGQEQYNKFVGNKVLDHAADWWADQHIEQAAADLASSETGPLTGHAKELLRRNLAHETRFEPEVVHQAARDMLAQANGDDLIRRIHQDITNSNLSPVEYLKGNGANYIAAHDDLRTVALFAAPDAFDELGRLTNPKEASKVGIARVDTLTKDDANWIADKFQAEHDRLQGQAREAQRATYEASLGNGPIDPDMLAGLGASVEDTQDLEQSVRAVLFSEFGIASHKMPQDLQGRIDKIRELGGGLAADATELDGYTARSPELQRALDRIEGRGYKVVIGKGIGRMAFTENQLDLMKDPLTWQRKVAGRMGLTPEIHSNRTIASFRRAGIRQAIQDLVDADKIRLPNSWTPDTVLDYLERKDILDRRMSIGGFSLPVRVPKSAIREAEQVLIAEGVAPEQAAQFAKSYAESEVLNALQVRDVPRKRVVEALTSPEKFGRYDEEAQAIAAEAGIHDWGEMAPFTREEANRIYKAVVKGSAAPKAYMLGAQRLDDLFRASMGFAGEGLAKRAAAGAVLGTAGGLIAGVKSGDHSLDHMTKLILEGAGAGTVIAAAGGDELGWKIANLPNWVGQVRNDLRFTLSPYFSFRRIAKTNVKLALEGVSPTLHPLAAMENAGTLAEDRARLRDVLPAAYNEISDDADRYLRENDIFGFYNARNYEAYALGQWSRTHPAATVEEQRSFITKTFGYGTRTQEGRSALERTANFVFFPFSFEKTLYRNLGGYLLDHPGQQILLTRGLAAYDAFQKKLDDGDPRTTAWWNNHLPVLQEAERLNAFAHGVTPGELGGINRPLLNVFLPQSWSSSGDNLDTLHRFVPAVKDLQRLRDVVVDQYNVAHAAFNQMVVDLGDGPSKQLKVSAESARAQQDDAFELQRQWYAKYADAIEYNERRGKKEAWVFHLPADSPWAKFDGETVNKNTINHMIAARFPAFDPNASKFAAIKDEQITQYRLKHKGTETGEYAATLLEYVQALQNLMNKPGSISNEQVAQYTQKYRDAAIWLAEHEPDFLAFYNKNLRRALGPLTGVDQRG